MDKEKKTIDNTNKLFFLFFIDIKNINKAVAKKNTAIFDSRAILEVYICHGLKAKTAPEIIAKLIFLLHIKTRYPKKNTVKVPKITETNLTDNSELPKK